MPNGYNGKILHVDLTTGTLTVEEPGEAFYRKYLGGSAMGVHYILQKMPQGADPLGPRTHHHSEAQPPRQSEPAWARYGI